MDGILAIILVVIPSALTYFLTKQKNATDMSKTEMETVEIAVRIWREMAQEFQTKLDDMEDKYKDLLQEVKQLRTENKKLKENQKI
jgi:peptidoglycan hydrolase CwlO-like protein